MPKISVVSLGCPKNQIDTEVTLGYLTKAGYQFTSSWEEANILLINTCAFIQPAREEAYQNIDKMVSFKKYHPDVKIVVFGCLPQLQMKAVCKKYPEVDAFLGVGCARQLPVVLKKLENNKQKIIFKVNNPDYLYTEKDPRIFIVKNDGVGESGARQRRAPDYLLPVFAYLKIAEGCNNFCRYCLVPRIRGPLRSRKIDSIIREAEWFAEKGIKEIILVAQDTTAYGEDIYGKRMLPQLLTRLTKINMVKWIRVLYNHPEKVTDKLIEVVAQEPKICKYFDLPFQHVSERILKAMGRKNNMKSILNLIRKIREKIKGVVIRSSFIIGFPGEKEEDHKLLLDFLTEVKVDRAGFFIYSREPKTPASKLPFQVSEKIKKARFESAYQVQSKISYQLNKNLIGTVNEVLIDGKNSSGFFGRTFRDAPEIDGKIYLTSPKNKKLFPGQIVQAKVTGARMYDLVGEALI